MRRFLKSLLVLALVFSGSLLLGGQAQAAPTTSGCDEYAIMRCGADDAQSMVNRINNAPAERNLKAIYARYGLSEADYKQFRSDNKQGTISKDGSITVDGKVVGKSVMNLGRIHEGAFDKKVTINGQTYWGGSFDDTYHADSAKVLVLMKNGKLVFAALVSCGNPQQLTPPPTPPAPPQPPKPEPTYACVRIFKTAVTNQKNTYSFTAKAKVDGGAKITAVGYDFGNGIQAVANDPSEPVTHTFAASATARAIVQVHLPNNDVKYVSSDACVTNIAVANTPPPVTPQSGGFCSQFKDPELLNEDQNLYRFTVVASTTNSTFTRADFKFSDNPSAVLPATPNGSLAIINHAFAEPGDYTVTATLYFTGADGVQTSGDCVTTFTIDQPDEDTPEEAESDCGKSESDETSEQSSGKGDECELTDTGPGTVVAGIFGGASALAAAGHFVIRRRLLGL